jgi:hypothetical protein
MIMEEAQANDLKQLEWELDKIFKDLEEGTMLTLAEIDTLRYACGMPNKSRANVAYSAIFNEFGHIFGGKK